jgi:hypothetical protein
MENQQTPFQAGLNAGVIMGVVGIVGMYVTYFIEPTAIVGGYSSLVQFVLAIGILLYLGIQYRKSIGGFMEFGTAFNFSFIALLISLVLGFMGSQLLYLLIDPSLPEVLAEAQLENMVNMAEKFAGEGAISSAQIDEMRKTAADSFSLGGQLKAIGIASIGYAVFALIIGAILKKRDKSLDY